MEHNSLFWNKKKKKKRKEADTKHIIYILFKTAPVLSCTCIYILVQMLYRLSLHTSIWRFKQEIMGENSAPQYFIQSFRRATFLFPGFAVCKDDMLKSWLWKTGNTVDLEGAVISSWKKFDSFLTALGHLNLPTL